MDLETPYDMCFSPEGELFTFDSDMEWDFNLPWYRATRVNHLVSGADFAWRQIDGKRFDYFPDVWSTVGEIGRGSPTATSFGTNAAFPEKYQRALFLGDWSYGKIYAMFLEENGATYTGQYETFATGQPLNITDMIVGKDGAMYFVTGGNGTDTGLFRIVYKGKDKTKAVKPAKNDKNVKLRALRKSIEQDHFQKDSTGLGKALAFIGHSDTWIRHSARVILERNSPELWKEELTKTNDFNKKTALLTALIRTDTISAYQDLTFKTLNELDFNQQSHQQQLVSLRLINLAFLRVQKPPIHLYTEQYNIILKSYPSDNELVNLEMSRTLGYLAGFQNDASETISKTFELIETTKNPKQFIHYLNAIRRIETGWTIDQRLAFQHWIQYGIDNLSGGSLFAYFLGQIQKEFEETITPAEHKLLATLTPKPLKEGYQGPVKPRPKRTASGLSKREAIYNWTFDDLEYSMEYVTSPREKGTRDYQRGYRLFQEGQCADCHSMLQRGGNFGPELTTAGNSYSAEGLLRAIVEPSKDITSRFQETDFNLKDGSMVWGRLINETSNSYIVQRGFNPANTKTVLKKDVVSKNPSQTSGMPPALLNTMDRGEILDLLYFIMNVAPKGLDSLEIDIVEDKAIFENGDSSLIEILNYANRGKVYYTTDGSAPTSKSRLYESPFFTKNSTFIKAIAIDGKEKSQVKSRSVHMVDASKNGLRYQMYKNISTPFQSYSGKTPSDEGVIYAFDIRNLARDENQFTVVFNGYLEIDEGGEYTFYTFQNDQSKMWIDGKLIVNGTRSWGRITEGKVNLSKGKHKIRLEFFDNMASETLKVEYQGPSFPRQEIRSDRLWLE